MATEWEKKYFVRRERLHQDIDDKGFTVALGLRMHKDDVQWYAHYIKDARKREEFKRAAHKLIAGKKFKTGMDVPRGIAIEHLYYKIAKGYSDEQYAKHAQSYD